MAYQLALKSSRGLFKDKLETFLSPYLCGYRKGYSVQHALIALLEKSRLSLDNKGYGGAILMDLSKAFVTLSHDLLIAKLHAYGFSKKTFFFIKSHLSNRWQRTKINNSYSSWTELLLGVPQDSILGPLLFNINLKVLFSLHLTQTYATLLMTIPSTHVIFL